MGLKFTKMHGCGNDYIYFDCMEKEIDDPTSLAIKISDRHFGVGGDGIVLICSSKVADAKMRMFNIDGSEGKMCGNAIRCVSKYLYDNKIVSKKVMTIETLSGIKEIKVTTDDEDKVILATVDMGKAEFDPKKIPVSIDLDKVIAYEKEFGGKKYKITCVSMGNPHCVIFTDEKVSDIDLYKIGPIFEKNEIFPEGVNTEFINVIDKNTLDMRVWERGSGETLACGTGACASVAAAVANGYCNYDEDVNVHLIGGTLTICCSKDTVKMTGSCKKVFEGEY